MRYRSFLIPAIGLVVVIAGFLFFAIDDSLVYFRTPTELLDDAEDLAGERMRLGGQVVEGTVEAGGTGVRFEVTDGVQAVTVVHQGAPQQLFQEGIGVVVEGRWHGDVFNSDTMIIRHDEQYRTSDGEEYHVPDGDDATP